MIRHTIFGQIYTPAYVFEPETILYMGALGIPFDSTVYFPSTPQEITGENFWYGIDTFVKTLITYGLKSKLDAFYPFRGGTLDRIKYNLLNPLNTDAAYRITYIGGVNPFNTGVKSNGVNGYLSTNLNPNAQGFTVDKISIGYYSRTATTSTMDVGTVPYDGFMASAEYGSGYQALLALYTYGISTGRLLTPTIGFMQYMRDDANVNGHRVFKNSTSFAPYPVAPRMATPTNQIIRFCGGHTGTSNRELACAYISRHNLTNTEALNLNTAVQTLLTTFNSL